VKTSKPFYALVMIAAVAASIGACKSTTKASGRVALSVKDGPPISSDKRTIAKLEIDITRIALSTDSDGQNGPDVRTDAGPDTGEQDVVAFDAGTGAPHTVDLLTVTTFSSLVTTATVPAGTYGGADVTISGARVVFSDDPTKTVALVLEGDGRSHAEFEFKFKPAATVTTTTTSLAVIDFVPVVTKDALGQYWLGHDGDNDQSGESNEGGEVELKGTIATVSGNTITLGTPAATVDVSTAKIEKAGAAATVKDLAVGQTVSLEGRFDSKTSVITANEVHIK
jgi:hypothetical protein